MKVIEGVPWLGPAVAAGAMLLASAIAVLATWPTVQDTRTLSNTPRATLESPVPTAAVYRGQLFSLVPRSTPLGTRGAAFWWWVGKTGKNRRTSCSELVSDQLVLRDGGKEVRVEMFADRLGVSLLADGRSEWSEGRIIDLGSSSLYEGDVPPGAARCDGMSYQYQERVVAEGTPVEILGCYSGGELRACPGTFPGVLAVPTLSVHIWRRAQRAHLPMRVVAVLGLAGLVLLSVLGQRMRTRRHTTELRPEHRE